LNNIINHANKVLKSIFRSSTVDKKNGGAVRKCPKILSFAIFQFYPIKSAQNWIKGIKLEFFIFSYRELIETPLWPLYICFI